MSHHEKCTQLAKMCTQLSRESFSIEGSQPGENDSQLKCVHFRGKKCTQLEKIFWKIGKFDVILHFNNSHSILKLLQF